MSLIALRYIAVVIFVGTVLLVVELSSLNWHEPLQFLVLTGVAMVASGMKVALPGVTGTISLSFLFVLIGIARLEPAQTMVLALSTTLVQRFWSARQRPGWVQVTFNLGVAAIGVAVAQAVFHWPLLLSYGAELPLRLGLASVVFFVANTAPIAIVIALTEGKRSFAVWKASYIWCVPYYLAGATIAWLYDYTSRWWGWEWALLVLPPMVVLYRSYRMYLDRLEGEKSHAEDMAALHIRTIEALAMSIDAKDHNTQEHLRRVQVYALELGKALGLSADELEALRTASVLHDVGKLAVPEHIISKPAKLTPEEFEKMKIHPEVGADILERVQFPYPVAPMVRAHHEKWDGSGYPHGLRGEEIPMGARILSVVDCFDALASDRPYHRALPMEEALEYVVKAAGTSYDPRVVETLRLNYREYEAKALHAVREIPPLKVMESARAANSAVPATGLELTAHGRRDGATSLLNTIANAQREVMALVDLSAELGQSPGLEKTLEVVGSRLQSLIPCNTLALYLVRRGALEAVWSTGEESDLYQALRIPVGQGVSGWVAETGQPIINGTPSLEMGYLNDPALFSNLESALAVPLDGERGINGVLTLYRSARDAFSRDELRLLQSVGPRLTQVIQEAAAHVEMAGGGAAGAFAELPGRLPLLRHLQECSNAAAENGSEVTVLICRLDRFQNLRERYGRLSGSRILNRVASEIQSSGGRRDYVAALDGDVFALVVAGLDRAALERRISEFGNAARTACAAVCGDHTVTVSVGSASSPGDGTVAEELVDLAHRRMLERSRAQGGADPPPRAFGAAPGGTGG